MKIAQIGPLPLLDGVQLQAAQGKPSGLLRAMNVEPRESMLQTRRGSQLLQAVKMTPDGSVTTMQPANWTGQTQTFIGVIGALAAPDQIASLGATGNIANGDESLADGESVLIEFWGDDLAWHALEYVNLSDVLYGKWIQQGGFRIAFVVPHGWRNDNVGGTLPGFAQWLRLTRTNAWSAAATFGISSGIAPPISGFGPQSVVAAPTTRLGCGPFVITPYFFQANVAQARWAVIDTWRAPKTTGVSIYASGDDYIAQAALIANAVFDGTPAQVLYIAASDKLFLALSGAYFEIDCSKAAGDVGACSLFVPIIDPDGQYGDIDCEGALLPSPSAMAVFGKRVFIGGFASNPSMLRWSAPDAFWETWPSSNVAFLNGGASGKILAMIPLKETLFIFTASGIWRAQLGDPPAGNESALFIDVVEMTPCLSARSVVACGDSICFLASDGIRRFDGVRSRLVSEGVRDLFRPDSAHPLACMRPATAIGVWHPIENQFRLSYSSPDAQHNDVVVVVDLDDRTAWIWGTDQLSSQNQLDAGFVDAALVIQRPRGVRVAGWAWDPRRQGIVLVDPEGLIGLCDIGERDFLSPTRWYFETQNLRIASDERSTLCEVDFSIMREHFQSFLVTAVPDGNRALVDTRTVSVDPDGLDTTAVVGQAPLAANVPTLQLDASIAPVHARFRQTARNHRLRIDSVAPNHEPIKLLAMTAEIIVQERDR